MIQGQFYSKNSKIDEMNGVQLKIVSQYVVIFLNTVFEYELMPSKVNPER